MNKARYIVIGCFGIFLSFAALWGGAYLLHRFTYEDWQEFPTFFTALFAFIGGAALAALGFIKASELK